MSQDLKWNKKKLKNEFAFVVQVQVIQEKIQIFQAYLKE